MAVLEIKSGLSTKEFTLDIGKDWFYLSAVAYGGWTNEEFKTKQELERYLKETWSFTNEQVAELMSVATYHE